MENTGAANGPGQPVLGPRPGRPSARTPSLSASRTRLLEVLRAQHAPTSLTALASTTGLHVNTVREHLDALQRSGLVTRRPADPSGRGRPAMLYEAVEPERHGDEYAGLAATLARAIHRSSPDPSTDGVAAGTEWGREIASGKPRAGRHSAAASRRQVVGVLDDLGFAPEPDRRHHDVRLTRCPLLEAAQQYPDVVCAVHLGIVRGALEVYGARDDGTELLPFAEPGACLLRIRATEVTR